MKLLKSILGLLGGLLVGVIIGALAGGLIVMVFTDTTFEEYIAKYNTIDLWEYAAAALVGVVSLVVSVTLLVPLHEGGHLICGLASGYRFVSFRIFSLTWLKDNGRLRVKHYSIAGTGGQCLLSPPDIPLSRIPTALYNLGGIIANFAALLIAASLFLLDSNAFFKEFLAIFCLIDAFMLVLNGIPMPFGGINNDAYNVRMLRRSPESKRGFVIQLRSNALIQPGVRPKDMPAEWFAIPDRINYANALEAAIPIMAASRLLDCKRYEEAYQAFEDLYSKRTEIMGLYVKEIQCELIYTALLTGRKDRARSLLNKEISEYIKSSRKIMSSKERILCAIDLYLNDDYDSAYGIYTKLIENRDRYLLQGEVSSDIALMSEIVRRP